MRTGRLRRWAARRYPIWSVKTISLVATVVLILSCTVFLLRRTSVFVETELVLFILSLSLFVFLSVGLYRGVRVRKNEPAGKSFEPVSLGDLADYAPDVGLPDVDCPVDVADGCLGAILGSVLAIVALFGVVLLFWLAVNMAILSFFVLSLAFGWIFARALRVVFAKSRICRGKIGHSISYAILYTALYTGWIFVALHLTQMMIGKQ